MAGPADSMIQSGIFEDLQRKIDEDTQIKDVTTSPTLPRPRQISDIEPGTPRHRTNAREARRVITHNLITLSQAEQSANSAVDRTTQSILSRAHSTPSAQLPSVVTAAQESIAKEVAAIQTLAATAGKYPYYRFNYAWTRTVQDACFSILLCGYLGGFGKAEGGQLLTIEEVGGVMNIPVNLKDRDAFHLTIEEYLLSLVSLIEELARLARNAVTLGDYARAPQISAFIKAVHAGFQILNLKNDALRKRSDGIKYRVKDVEDVVYDLSLRGLVGKE